MFKSHVCRKNKYYTPLRSSFVFNLARRWESSPIGFTALVTSVDAYSAGAGESGCDYWLLPTLKRQSLNVAVNLVLGQSNDIADPLGYFCLRPSEGVRVLQAFHHCSSVFV